MNKGIGSFHPLVSFIYFFMILFISMFFMHPIFIFISLLGGIIYSSILNLKKTKMILTYSMFMVFCITLVNAIFVNKGMTVLFFFRGNPITLESILYGLTSSIMMLSVIIWFNCYNEIITTDKFLYIFSKIIPTISLMISMTIRLIPKLIKQGKEIIISQRSIGIDVDEKSLLKKIKNNMRVLSVLVTWALEDIIITADSMKARGYGIKKRSSFSIYKFIDRDFFMLIILSILFIFIMMSYFYGYGELSFYPMISNINTNKLAILIYVLFFIMSLIPSLLEILEEIKWKYLK